MLNMVDSIEFFMLPSSEFRLITLMKNIERDDHQILGVCPPPIYIRVCYFLKNPPHKRALHVASCGMKHWRCFVILRE